MSEAIRDTLYLDRSRFNSQTRRWNVPTLMLEGVNAKNLVIVGQELSEKDFRIDGNYIAITNDEINIGERTEAHLIIEIQSKNLLEKFWVPIIVAIIGLIGIAVQPALHYLGVLYASTPPPVEYTAARWGYDSNKHEYYINVVIKNLNDKEKETWKMIVALRKYNESVDPQEDTYTILSNSFNLNELLLMRAEAGLEFTTSLLENNIPVQGVLFKVRKGTTLNTPFQPKNFSSDTVLFIKAYSTSLN